MVVQKKIETYFQAGLLMVFSPQFPSFQLDGVKLCLSMHKIVTTSCLIYQWVKTLAPWVLKQLVNGLLFPKYGSNSCWSIHIWFPSFQVVLIHFFLDFSIYLWYFIVSIWGCYVLNDVANGRKWRGFPPMVSDATRRLARQRATTPQGRKDFGPGYQRVFGWSIFSLVAGLMGV